MTRRAYSSDPEKEWITAGGRCRHDHHAEEHQHITKGRHPAPDSDERLPPPIADAPRAVQHGDREQQAEWHRQRLHLVLSAMEHFAAELRSEGFEVDHRRATTLRQGLRDHIDDFFYGVEVPKPDQAVAVGGSATSLRTLVGAVLEYETLERAVRVLAGDPIADVAKRFELDPRRVRILPAGVLLLEKLSELLGQPLQIGKGGLREGIILDLLNGSENGAPVEKLAA